MVGIFNAIGGTQEVVVHHQACHIFSGAGVIKSDVHVVVLPVDRNDVPHMIQLGGTDDRAWDPCLIQQIPIRHRVSFALRLSADKRAVKRLGVGGSFVVFAAQRKPVVDQQRLFHVAQRGVAANPIQQTARHGTDLVQHGIELRRAVIIINFYGRKRAAFARIHQIHIKKQRRTIFCIIVDQLLHRIGIGKPIG